MSFVTLSDILQVMGPATGVTASVVIKNASKHLATRGVTTPLTVIGKPLFVGSWAWLLWSLTNGSPMASTRNQVLSVSIPSIVVAVFAMMAAKEMDTPPAWLPVAAGMFIAGWLGFGYGAGLRPGDTLGTLSRTTQFGLTGGALAIVSMMKVLPVQRDMALVDGPGFSMFTMAWLAVALANGLR